MVGSEDYMMLSMPQCLSKLLLKYLMHSMEDGTMGILMCSCDAQCESGQFYGPLGKGYSGIANGYHDQASYKGKAVLLPEECLADKESRAMLWETSEASTGVKFVI